MEESEWPFEDQENTWAFTTKAVIERGEPVLYVWHDADDGAWQFRDGSDAEIEDIIVVGLGEVVGKDPTLKSLADLPLGWCAWRKDKSDMWKREKDQCDELLS